MSKQSIKSFYELVIFNRIKELKKGIITNAQYIDWIKEVLDNLKGLGFTHEEAYELITNIERGTLAS